MRNFLAVLFSVLIVSSYAINIDTIDTSYTTATITWYNNYPEKTTPTFAYAKSGSEDYTTVPVVEDPENYCEVNITGLTENTAYRGMIYNVNSEGKDSGFDFHTEKRPLSKIEQSIATAIRRGGVTFIKNMNNTIRSSSLTDTQKKILESMFSETYIINRDDPEAYAKQLVSRFNNTIFSNEIVGTANLTQVQVQGLIKAINNEASKIARQVMYNRFLSTARVVYTQGHFDGANLIIRDSEGVERTIPELNIWAKILEVYGQ